MYINFEITPIIIVKINNNIIKHIRVIIYT